MKHIGWLAFYVLLFLLVKLCSLPKTGDEISIPKVKFATLLENPTTYAGVIVETEVHICRCEFIGIRSVTWIAEDAGCKTTKPLISSNSYASGNQITLKTKIVLLQYSSNGSNGSANYFFKEVI